MSDLIKLYNPANASQLSSSELEGLQKLTSAQIKELAQAYPNAAMPKAYLLIKDGAKPLNKELPQLSTFANLWNLREKNGLRSYIAVGFRGNVQAKAINTVRRTEVRDLSDTELMSLPGFKTATKEHKPETVRITNIKKVPFAEVVEKPASKKAKTKSK